MQTIGNGICPLQVPSLIFTTPKKNEIKIVFGLQGKVVDIQMSIY